MSSTMVAVLGISTLVVTVGLLFFLRNGPISRRPKALILYPPKGETFPNGRAFLHFLIPYGINTGIYMPEDIEFTAVADNPPNLAIIGVPENAKLNSIKLFLVENDNTIGCYYYQIFWPMYFRLSESVAGAQSITLFFSIPGSIIDESYHFPLV